jgi:hypothetical protein
MYRAMTNAEQARPVDKPKGGGVTVTDWRLYTADHRHIDGAGGTRTLRRHCRNLGGAAGDRPKESPDTGKRGA